MTSLTSLSETGTLGTLLDRDDGNILRSQTRRRSTCDAFFFKKSISRCDFFFDVMFFNYVKQSESNLIPVV